MPFSFSIIFIIIRQLYRRFTMACAYMNRLPDELLLEIVSYLHLLTKYASTPPTNKAQDKDDERYEENISRKFALWSLCLTSRRICRIATPILYSTFILDLSTRPSKSPTYLLLKTLIARPELAPCITYIENRIEDAVAARDDPHFMTWRTSAQCDAPLLVAVARKIWGCDFPSEENSWGCRLEDHPDEAELALLIALAAPNLRHLYLASLESFPPSIWDFVGFEARNGLESVQTRAFPKLENLCIELEERDSWVSGGAWFTQLAGHLPNLPALRYLHTNGMFCKDPKLPLRPQSLAVQSIYLSNCNLDLGQVCDFVRACRTLKQFACHYQPVDCSRSFDLGMLKAALLEHRSTLEKVYLNVHQVVASTRCIQPLGPLYDFTHLTDVALCTTSLFGSPKLHGYEHPQHRLGYWNFTRPRQQLSELLPAGVEKFMVTPGTFVNGSGGIPALHELFGACGRFYKLTKVGLGLCCEAARLEEKFARRGIELIISDKEFLP
jgi:hypothetical protein